MRLHLIWCGVDCHNETTHQNIDWHNQPSAQIMSSCVCVCVYSCTPLFCSPFLLNYFSNVFPYVFISTRLALLQLIFLCSCPSTSTSLSFLFLLLMLLPSLRSSFPTCILLLPYFSLFSPWNLQFLSLLFSSLVLTFVVLLLFAPSLRSVMWILVWRCSIPQHH